MSDSKELNTIYKQNLENDIISYLADLQNIEWRESFDIYYNSKLSLLIERGEQGIANLDPKYLVEDLIENDLMENERELF